MSAIATPVFPPPDLEDIISDVHLHTLLVSDQLNIFEFLIERDIQLKNDCYSRALTCQLSNILEEFKHLKVNVFALADLRGEV
ncbi:MAG: hypothetical protein HRU28_11200 [Rhizobiales bacterium]|nr:hypothetical protein [Hyphomicrobiales bacterium]